MIGPAVFFFILQHHISNIPRYSCYCISLFLERDYPEKIIMWYFLHFLSAAQNSSRSDHSGHVCCYTFMKHLEHNLLCALSRY